MIPNLSKEMIHILQQLRKRLRSEFGEDIKLSNPDIIQQLLELVDKSHDQKTILLFADLEDMLGITLEHSQEGQLTTEGSALSDESSTVIRRVYRGQVIEERVARKAPDMVPANSQITKRIYRGQEVVA
jgi:hypothetical protein